MNSKTRSTMADAMIVERRKSVPLKRMDEQANLRLMAHALAEVSGCTYNGAKRALQRAIARARGEGNTWGGERQNMTGRQSAHFNVREQRAIDQMKAAAEAVLQEGDA